MKSILFDTGPIISLSTNNLLFLLPELKKAYGGEFILVESVKKELVDKPMKGKKFKFEALQVQKMIQDGVFKVMKDPKIFDKAQKMLDLSNRVFRVRRQPLQILQMGEVEAITAAIELKADAFVCDERITRTLIESPRKLEQLYERRLHEDVKIDDKALREFSEKVKTVKVIRSVELVTVAFEKGMLDKYVVKIPQARKQLLDSLLWAVKLHGAAVTPDEIRDLVQSETKK